MLILLRVGLVVLLAVGVAGFDVTPARAATRLYLSASRNDVVEGDGVVFRGLASGTRPGAVVALQRLVAGNWTRVDRIRLGHRDGFRFTTVPPRGRQRYRVRMVRQAGQRLSPSTALTVRVHWRPDLRDVAATYDADQASGDVRAEATGRVPAVPDGTVLTREDFDGTPWVAVGTTTITGHRWRDEFTTSYGSKYRYTLAASGLRVAGSSPAMEALARASLPVDATTDVSFPTEERHLSVALEAGQTYTYSGPYWVGPRMTDPTGRAVPGFGSSYDVITFRASTSGIYTLDLRGNPAEQQPARITLSRPVAVATSLDAASLDLKSSLPNQLVDLSFEGEPGHYVSQHDAAPWAPVPHDVHLLAPNGQPVPLVTRLDDGTRVWRLPDAGGSYTMRVTPAYVVDTPDFEVRSVVDRTMPLDAEATTVDFDRTGRVAVLETTTPAGADISFASTPARTHVLLAPDGSRVTGAPAVLPTLQGVYRMVVAAPQAGSVDFFASTAVWFDAGIDGPDVPFDLGPAVGRDALLRIPAEAGDVFSVATQFADGGRCTTISDAHPTSSAVTLHNGGGAHPTVVVAEEAGTVVVRITPCRQQGSFSVRRVTPVTMEPVWPRTQRARATFERPGDVAMLMYDAGEVGSGPYNRGVTFSMTGSDLTDADPVTFAGPRFLGFFDEPVGRMMSGVVPVIFWGGPRATGWVDIEATW